MVAYAGDPISIKVEALDPYTKLPLTTGYTCLVDVYAAGLTPKTTPAVRDDPASILLLGLQAVYDTDRGAYFVTVPTNSDGFTAITTPTKFWYRVRIVGPAYVNIEFGSFKLAP